MKLLIAIAALLLSSAVQADTIWDINGQITSIGNNNATVIVDYSYVLDAASFGDYITSSSASGSGSLGNAFSMGSWNGAGYVPIFDAEGDEIDLESSPVPMSASWYSCVAKCVADFIPEGFTGDSATDAAFDGAAPFTMTQTASDPVGTPEPSTATMLLCGILFVLALLAKRPRSESAGQRGEAA